MKKLAAAAILTSVATLAGSGAFAADLGARQVYAPPPPMMAPPAPVFTWTGFYIGGNGGYGFSNDHSIDLTATNALFPFTTATANFGNLRPSGGFGGGQIGYNFQTGAVVWGIEADFQGSGIRDAITATQTNLAGTVGLTTLNTTENLKWFGTVRGRLGYAMDRTLLYVTGGYAYGRVSFNQTLTDPRGNQFTNGIDDSKIRGGYTVGGGIEYAFNQNWTGKLEYQYINLGSATVGGAFGTTVPPASFSSATNSIRFDYHTARVGLNYKF